MSSGSTRSLTVFLVDDHPIVRKGLRRLLRHEPHLTVVGEASNGEEALDQILEASPDVAIVDISMEGMNGLELTRQLKNARPSLPVLVVSMHKDSLHINQAREAGANGYISKSQAEERITEAIEEVLSGLPFYVG